MRMPSRAAHFLLCATVATSLASACQPWASGKNGPAGPAPAPRIVYAETIHDAGHLAPGAALQHVFTVRNQGGRDLSIDNVRTGCGCTATAVTRTVAPGAEGAIEARCDTSNDFGPQTRTVTVYSNDPAQPVSTLTLRADVEAEVAADPAQLYVGHVQRGDTLPREVRAIAAAGEVSVDQVRSSGPVLQAALTPPAPGGLGKRVRLTIQPGAPLGRFEEAITVYTSSPRRPTLTVAVAGIVDGAPVAPSAPK